MTMTFIIVYVVIALILVGGLNLFIVKRNKQKSTRKMEQAKYESIASNESYQSKFKVKDDKTTTENQEQNKGETTEEKAENASHANSDTAESSTQHDSDHEQINPNSEEAQVNEKLKAKHSSVMFGKGTSQGKVLIAMIFGMLIAILNQTLLNVALPKINTDFNISANTGQWLMTGFMLVNCILIPISAYLFNKYSYRKLFLIAMALFTIGS